MSTREIPRDEWVAFFEGFSRRHWNWPATVEILGKGLGAQIEACAVPLQGIFCEPRGASITMLLGGDRTDHLEHPVEGPRRVWLETAEDGTEAALEIESGNGTLTILEFPTARSSETAQRTFS